MSVETSPTVKEDAQAVTEAYLAGRAIPSDVARRVEARAAELREQIFREHGFLNIAVSSIRESREAGH